MNKERRLARLAMNIVNQLFDLVELPVEKRQVLNDKADDFVYQLLLSESNTGAITEAAHSANTNVGRSAASKDVQSIGDGGADSSETAVVGQNEQTKEFIACVGCPYPNACTKNAQCDKVVYELMR